jgi:hypothetical protein
MIEPGKTHYLGCLTVVVLPMVLVLLGFATVAAWIAIVGLPLLMVVFWAQDRHENKK